MNEEKNINEFNDLFKEHQPKPRYEDPINKRPYYLTIMYYLFIMFVFNSILFFALSSVNSLTKTYTEDEQVILQIASESAAMTLIPTEYYTIFTDDYDGYVVSLGQYEGFDVIVNTMNTYATPYLLDDANQLNHGNLENILTGARTAWDDEGIYEIVVYESATSPFPAIATISTAVATEPVENLTNFANSIINFIIYLALMPVLAFVLLRREITADLLVFKNKWSPFISAVLIGYALTLAGNFVANFTSSLIAQLLGVMQSTAANQLVIEQTLRSGGMVFMFISAVILGPIVEELVFRKSIFGLIKNETIALFVSAFAFGSIHLLSEPSLTDALINGFVYIFLGLVFGYIYIRNKKNIVINITVHMISNLVSVLAVLFLL